MQNEPRSVAFRAWEGTTDALWRGAIYTVLAIAGLIFWTATGGAKVTEYRHSQVRRRNRDMVARRARTRSSAPMTDRHGR